jgi:cellobiose-specific phosphotransferase system component IIC
MHSLLVQFFEALQWHFGIVDVWVATSLEDSIRTKVTKKITKTYSESNITKQNDLEYSRKNSRI